MKHTNYFHRIWKSKKEMYRWEILCKLHFRFCKERRLLVSEVPLPIERRVNLEPELARKVGDRQECEQWLWLLHRCRMTRGGKSRISCIQSGCIVRCIKQRRSILSIEQLPLSGSISNESDGATTGKRNLKLQDCRYLSWLVVRHDLSGWAQISTRIAVLHRRYGTHWQRNASRVNQQLVTRTRPWWEWPIGYAHAALNGVERQGIEWRARCRFK